MPTTEAELAESLLTPEAVRDRCMDVLHAGLDGSLTHFELKPEALNPTARFVADVMRQNYPGLDIPYHARWRHFTLNGDARWVPAFAHLEPGSAERARTRFDLTVTSVLLDAGAGDRWRYAVPQSDIVLARSEGLAIASLDAFTSGLFANDPETPLRADADALIALTEDDIARAFQVSAGNPLAGLAGRAALMVSLGRAVDAAPEYFGGPSPRIGNLFDQLMAKSVDGALPAREILISVLHALGPIWPGRLELGGHNLGDTWRHPDVRRDDATDFHVPFHKLSQWLSYSLVEPLIEAGLTVTGIDALTPLAEYRNGGLLVDCGVLAPRYREVREIEHSPADEVIIEWRALTVSLIDILADEIRGEVAMSAEELPLASILEGGTWAAGRRIAAERRDGAPPPIRIASDGSVF